MSKVYGSKVIIKDLISNTIWLVPMQTFEESDYRGELDFYFDLPLISTNRFVDKTSALLGDPYIIEVHYPKHLDSTEKNVVTYCGKLTHVDYRTGSTLVLREIENLEFIDLTNKKKDRLEQQLKGVYEL